MAEGSIPTGPQDLWTAVDHFLEQALLAPDPGLASTLSASRAAGLPEWQVSPLQGRFLWLLARLMSAEQILEVGTLGGYSTVWLARALPSDGHLLSLEADPLCASLARESLERAGLTSRVEVRCGLALDLLPRVAAEARRPFDLVFIDADKPSNVKYFDWAVRLSRPGGLVIVDNVVRAGRILDPSDPDPNVRGTRELIDHVRADRRVTAVVLPSVGVKGYDGVLLAWIGSEGEARPSA